MLVEERLEVWAERLPLLGRAHQNIGPLKGGLHLSRMEIL